MMRIILASTAILGLALSGCTQTGAIPAANAQAEENAASEVNLILIYRLKRGVNPADFEEWVVNTDQPEMRALQRVSEFRTYRAERLLIGSGVPSVQYIEAFSIPDLEGFVAEDLGGEKVQAVMSTFMGFADQPELIVVSEVK